MNEYRIEEAARRREQEEAKLFRPDRSKLYADEEHAERVRSIKARHRAEFDRIDADVGRKVEEAEQRLLVAENADPTRALTRGELEKANLRRAFVEDEVGELPPDKLAQRCQASIASGDRVGMFLLSLAAGRRAAEEVELGDLVAELRAKLDPDQERKLAAAREAVEEAQSLKERAYYRRRGVKDAMDLYAQSGYWTSGS